MAIIQVNNIDLYYESYGEGEVLLLLAGFGSNHVAWTSVLSRLIRHYRVILVDNRGTGQSSCPDYPYTIDMMAQDVAQLCQALDLRNVHFVGSSMGGCIVQTLAYHQPQLFASAVIANSFSRMDARRRLFYQAHEELMSVGAPETALVRDKLSWIFSNSYLEKPGRLERLVEQWVKNSQLHPFALTGFRHQVAAVAAFNSTDWLDKIHVPCLVIGCDDDLIAPEATTRHMAQAINGAEYLCLTDTGHLPYLERPKEFVQAITNFIGQVS